LREEIALIRRIEASTILLEHKFTNELPEHGKYDNKLPQVQLFC